MPLVSALWLAVAPLACRGGGDPLPVAVVAPADFEVRVAAHGELEARVSTLVATPAFDSAQPVGWIVEEGTRVKVGDPLVEFDTTELARAREGAAGGLESAKMRIVQREARLVLERADARAAIDRAEIDTRMARLRVTDSESVSAIDREQARVDVERAEIAAAKARSALETLELQARAELELLRLEVAQKTQRLAAFDAQLAQGVVTAPTDGIAIPYRRPGSLCWPGSRLAALPDLSTLQVVAWVPEIDAPRVAVGQPATVVVDAWPRHPLAGRVAQVADLAVVPPGDDDDDEEQGDTPQVKQLRMVIALEGEPDAEVKLKPGMTARADLLVAARPAALSVPIQAVRRDDEGPYVHVDGLAGWSRAPVALGPENPLRVVVESGLTAGQTVALADPSAWARGERPVAVP